jgi:NADH-quinone oxidoreductase subunit L
MVFSITLALLGILLATITYYWNKISAKAWAERFPLVYRLLLNKYYIDEFYQKSFIGGTLLLANAIRWFDAHIIDGIVNGVGRLGVLFSDFTGNFDLKLVDGLVNGIADTTHYFGARLRKIQTGQIQTYLVSAVVGVLVIMIIQVLY